MSAAALRAHVDAAAEQSAAEGHVLIAECAKCQKSAEFASQAERRKWSKPHEKHQLYHYIRQEAASAA